MIHTMAIMVGRVDLFDVAKGRAVPLKTLAKQNTAQNRMTWFRIRLECNVIAS
jgi:hypothetical protein